MNLKLLATRGQRPVQHNFTQSSRLQEPVQPILRRRELLHLGIALPILASGPAYADLVEATAATVEAEAAVTAPELQEPAPVAAPSPSPAAPKQPEPFLDLEFQIIPPVGFKFIDTQPPYDPNRRGPAPEPSPVRARFDSQDGSTVVSVVMRSAQTLKQSILQVSDISVFGGLEEVARLVLPRGSRVISGSTLQVQLPPRQTALGPVEVPPKNYFRYEFTTPNGLHATMTVAAMKGKVYVCGGSTAEGAGWEQYGTALREATESFRLRSEGAVL